MNIQPAGGFAAKHQENTIEVSSTKFIKIKPKSDLEILLADLDEHIQSFNDNIDSEELIIKLGHNYTLQATFINKRAKKGKKALYFHPLVDNIDYTVISHFFLKYLEFQLFALLLNLIFPPITF
ncbi:MAG: hypothetical protein OEW75_01900 [Cyclobacteriaceae bacterium]|nr:hypothetical protein [Cyclobacteriaceae bacterium]